MRGLFVGTVGALAIAAALAGLSLDAFRAGPFDRPLEPAGTTLHAEGTYLARAAQPDPVGVGGAGPCLRPPCEPATEVDLAFRGAPPVPYEARLDGPGGPVPLGTFEPEGGVLRVRWSEAEDHSSKDRLVLAVAGRDVATLPVQGGPQPARVSATLGAAWPEPPSPATVHVNEVGGVTLSAIATARLPEAPPAGWEFRARFVGPGGEVALGALAADGGGGGSVLDGRAERVRLEDHDAVLVVLAPAGSADGPGTGFPVLRADLWP